VTWRQRPHLLLELLDGAEVRLVVGAHVGHLLLAVLLDAALQLRVLPLQLAHLLQVAGQTVVQELHGLLLVAIEGALAEPAAAAHVGGDVAGPGQGAAVAAGGHAGPGGAAGAAAEVGQAAGVRHGAGREQRAWLKGLLADIPATSTTMEEIIKELRDERTEWKICTGTGVHHGGHAQVGTPELGHGLKWRRYEDARTDQPTEPTGPTVLTSSSESTNASSSSRKQPRGPPAGPGVPSSQRCYRARSGSVGHKDSKARRSRCWLLALQQAAVRVDLTLQPGTHVQQHLGVPLCGEIEKVSEPLLKGLLPEVSQDATAASLRRHRAARRASPVSHPRLPTCWQGLATPTRLCWACSSISRALTVRLSSMISAWHVCSCSELDTTCLFSSSVCKGKGHTRVRPRLQGPRGLGSLLSGAEAHLGGEPLLHIPAVGLHQGFVLAPGLIEHAVQVHVGGSVHLHVEAGLHLGLQVSLAQGQLVQDPAQAVHVRLHQLAQAQLRLIPSHKAVLYPFGSCCIQLEELVQHAAAWHPHPHLLLELLDGAEVRLVVGAHVGHLLLAVLLDAALQLRVLPLQLAHLLQVAGQTVVQELHGLLLVAIEGALAEPAAAAHVGGDVAGPGQGAAVAAGGHAGPGGAAGAAAEVGQAAGVRHGAGREQGSEGSVDEEPSLRKLGSATELLRSGSSVQEPEPADFNNLSLPITRRPSPPFISFLALQQAAVRVDLTLQPGTHVQQHLVLLVLPLKVTADLGQLGLHVGDHALHLGQLGAVAGLRLRQGVLQGVPLCGEIEKVSEPLLKGLLPEGLATPTRLCWACSSISRALTVRLSSMISAWHVCSCSELDTTCLFSSSVCKGKGHTRVRPRLQGPRGLGSLLSGAEAHLGGEPLLHIPAVGLHQGFVLAPGLIEHAVQVHDCSQSMPSYMHDVARAPDRALGSLDCSRKGSQPREAGGKCLLIPNATGFALKPVFSFFFAHLLMVLLETQQLLLQGLHLGLQVSLAQGQLVQDPAQAVDVRLHQLARAALHLVPKHTGREKGQPAAPVTSPRPCPHLLLELLDGAEVRLVVGAHVGHLLPAVLLDAALQLRVLPLQLAHLLQVAGQTVVQELHGLLLVAIEGALAEPAAAAHVGGDVAGPGQGAAVAAGGHAGPGGTAGTAAQVGQAAGVRHVPGLYRTKELQGPQRDRGAQGVQGAGGAQGVQELGTQDPMDLLQALVVAQGLQGSLEKRMAAVRVDLALQPGTHVQQHLVLLVLPLKVTPDLSQLGLHGLATPTRLCWACSSISRALTVRLSSMISAWHVCSCSELDTTCLFSSSVCKGKGHTRVRPRLQGPRGLGSLLSGAEAHLGDPHLLLELLDGAEVRLVVGAHVGHLLLAVLLDAALQLRVLPLQLAHLLQVAGQTVVQELHGLLLVAIEGALAEPAAAAHVGGDVAGPGQGAAVAAGGHAGPGGAAGAAAQVGQAAGVRHGAGREQRAWLKQLRRENKVGPEGGIPETPQRQDTRLGSGCQRELFSHFTCAQNKELLPGAQAPCQAHSPSSATGQCSIVQALVKEERLDSTHEICASAHLTSKTTICREGTCRGESTPGARAPGNRPPAPVQEMLEEQVTPSPAGCFWTFLLAQMAALPAQEFGMETADRLDDPRVVAGNAQAQPLWQRCRARGMEECHSRALRLWLYNKPGRVKNRSCGSCCSCISSAGLTGLALPSPRATTAAPTGKAASHTLHREDEQGPQEARGVLEWAEEQGTQAAGAGRPRYVLISHSSRALTSSSTWYSWFCRSRSLLISASCSSTVLIRLCIWASSVPKRSSASHSEFCRQSFWNINERGKEIKAREPLHHFSKNMTPHDIATPENTAAPVTLQLLRAGRGLQADAFRLKHRGTHRHGHPSPTEARPPPAAHRGAPPHLRLEPLLHVPAVGLHHGLVLAPHLLQHPDQVNAGLGVQLNPQLVPQLAPQSVDLLWAQKENIPVLGPAVLHPKPRPPLRILPGFPSPSRMRPHLHQPTASEAVAEEQAPPESQRDSSWASRSHLASVRSSSALRRPHTSASTSWCSECSVSYLYRGGRPDSLGPEVICSELGIVYLHDQPVVLSFDAQDLLLDGVEVGLVVGAQHGLVALAPLLDLGLQLRVLPLQLAHLPQVVGQPVVQELHGHLLVAIQAAFGAGPAAPDVARNVAGTRQGAGAVAAVGQAEAGSAQRGGPHADPVGLANRHMEAALGSDTCPLKELQQLEVMVQKARLCSAHGDRNRAHQQPRQPHRKEERVTKDRARLGQHLLVGIKELGTPKGKYLQCNDLSGRKTRRGGGNPSPSASSLDSCARTQTFRFCTQCTHHLLRHTRRLAGDGLDGRRVRYVLISHSSRALTSSSTWYSWFCRSRSLLISASCSSTVLIRLCIWASSVPKRSSASHSEFCRQDTPADRVWRRQPGRGSRPYQVVLRLALHLQGVHRAPQLQDLRLAALQLLRAGRGLQADAFRLKHRGTHRHGRRWARCPAQSAACPPAGTSESSLPAGTGGPTPTVSKELWGRAEGPPALLASSMRGSPSHTLTGVQSVPRVPRETHWRPPKVTVQAWRAHKLPSHDPQAPPATQTQIQLLAQCPLSPASNAFLPSTLALEPAAPGPDLLVVALQRELLLLQGLLLGLQVSLGQAHVVHQLVHPAHVRLHHLAQGELALVPLVTEAPTPRPPQPHPLLQLLDGAEVGLVVGAYRGLVALAPLLDLGLQLRVLPLQLAHLPQLASRSFRNCMVTFSWPFRLPSGQAPQLPMLPGMLQVPGRGQALWQLLGRQRLGRPRGVGPTRIRLAWARLANRHMEAASGPGGPARSAEGHAPPAPGIPAPPRLWDKPMYEEVMLADEAAREVANSWEGRATESDAPFPRGPFIPHPRGGGTLGGNAIYVMALGHMMRLSERENEAGVDTGLGHHLQPLCPLRGHIQKIPKETGTAHRKKLPCRGSFQAQITDGIQNRHTVVTPLTEPGPQVVRGAQLGREAQGGATQEGGVEHGLQGSLQKEKKGPVRVDLALKPGLDVQQHLVLLVLPLQVTPDLGQLLLHGADQALHLGQLRAEAGVHRAPQLQDLRLAALQLLRAGRGLQADAFRLKHRGTHRHGRRWARCPAQSAACPPAGTSESSLPAGTGGPTPTVSKELWGRAEGPPALLASSMRGSPSHTLTGVQSVPRVPRETHWRPPKVTVQAWRAHKLPSHDPQAPPATQTQIQLLAQCPLSPASNAFLPSTLALEPAAPGPDLLVVALQRELLLLQGLLLGLQVSLGQAHVVHQLVHPAHVRLHHLAQGELALVPLVTEAPTPRPPQPHPLLQLLDGAEVGLVVGAYRGLVALAPLLDLGLQLRVLPLQLAHLPQVVGQPVVQELHGHLLVAIQAAFGAGPAAPDVARNVAGARQGAGAVAAVGQAEAGSAQRGGPHADPVGVGQVGQQAHGGRLWPRRAGQVSGGARAPCPGNPGTAQAVG
ncbi:LOW QUALITY PROTEIN: hypothetical protein J0S82_010804, partial [Galemys pyrenaicus]